MSNFEDILKSFSGFFKEFLKGSNASYGIFGFIFLAVWMLFYSLFDTLAVNIFKKNPRSSNKFSLSLSFVLALIFVFFLGVENKAFDIKKFYDNLTSLVFVLSFIPAGIFLIIQGLLKKKHQEERGHFKAGQLIYGFYGFLGCILLYVAFSQEIILEKLFGKGSVDGFILLIIFLFSIYFLFLIVTSISYKRKKNNEKFNFEIEQNNEKFNFEIEQNDEIIKEKENNKNILNNLNELIVNQGNFINDDTTRIDEIIRELNMYNCLNEDNVSQKDELMKLIGKKDSIRNLATEENKNKTYQECVNKWKKFYNSERNF